MGLHMFDYDKLELHALCSIVGTQTMVVTEDAFLLEHVSIQFFQYYKGTRFPNQLHQQILVQKKILVN